MHISFFSISSGREVKRSIRKMTMLNCVQSFNNNLIILGSNSSTFLAASNTKALFTGTKQVKCGETRVCKERGKSVIANGFLLPVDPWSPNIDSQSIASQLFAFSLFPYIGFLYFITKSKSAPKLTLFGFYFLLAFVGATIPAGIYAKVQYGTSLSNVDWLHGGAESLLTLTNLFIVLGLRDAIRGADETTESTSNITSDTKEADKSSN